MYNIILRHIKILALLLLVSIVEATDDNFGNGISHEHRQSRVTGRIVKLYSGTRPEPILCTGEGFQGDPHNCAVFYRCMKSGNGKYTVFKFQCGPGTVYDPETEICNHPRSTKRLECGGIPSSTIINSLNNNEIEGSQDELPSPITNKPIHTDKLVSTRQPTTRAKTSTMITTAKPSVDSSSALFITSTKSQPQVATPPTTLYPWGSINYNDDTINPLSSAQPIGSLNSQYNKVHKTTQPPKITPDIHQTTSRDNICMSDGFIGDSENCRKFYRCVGNQRGTYTRYEFSCSESTVWDDDTQSCNHAWAVKRSRCGRSNQNNDQLTSSNVLFTTDKADVPHKESSKDITIQQQLQISHGSEVTQTQTQISNGSVIQNQTQINYGDRINRNKGTKQNQTQISHGSAISQTQTQVDYSDKGVQTQLQIDHSQQSSQIQIQVHESTTKETTTFTNSASTNVNSQGNNKCEKTGFMGDINDCKKFYRCIDNGRGGYTKFDFLCGEGTVWDRSIEACNHAWAVKECGGKAPTDVPSTSHATISTSKSTQNYYPTVSTENYHTTSVPVATEEYEDSGYGQQNQDPIPSSSTTASPQSSASPSKGDCQSSGFIGDANDCTLFYRCVENGNGGFTRYEFKCGEGTVWDAELKACNHAWAVKICGGNVTPDIDKVETSTDKQTTLSTVHTQSTTTTHSTTEPIVTQNDDYDTGYGPANNDVTSTTKTTSTEGPQNIDQSTDSKCQFSGFMGDQNDCKRFYRCVDNGNGGFIRYEFTCGEGTVWDSKIEACNHAWAVEKCGGSGATADHQEVTTQSKPTTSHEVTSIASDQNTGTPLLISSTISSTSTVTEAGLSNKCTQSGFMGDRKDCKKFYRCVDNGNGSYTTYEFSCGEGTVWDPKIEACNHLWAVEKCGGTIESSNDHHETTTQYLPTLSDEIDNGYPSDIDTGNDKTTQSPTHSTTEGLKEPSEGNNCIHSGFIGDRNDCKKFYRCVDDGKGSFTRYEFSCGEGTVWDQSIEACNHVWAVKTCGKTGNDTVQTSNESTSHATVTSESEDLGYPQYTDKPSTSTNDYQDNEISNECSKEGFARNKKDCKKFYRCVDNGRGGFTKYEFTCGEGTYWNQEILSCDHASTNQTCADNESGSASQIPQNDEIYTEATTTSSSSTTEYINDTTLKPSTSSGVCTSEGFYGDQNDCKKFYRCVDNGKGSYTKYEFTCGDGTVWDQEIQACNHESSNNNCHVASTSSSSFPPITSQRPDGQSNDGNEVSISTASQTYSTEKTESSSISSGNQCTSEGFFAVPDDCRKFMRCVNNDKEGYTKYEFSCGEGTIWVQDILACDHDTGDTNCSSKTTAKPFTTEEYQHTTEKHELGSSTSEPQTIDKQEDEYDTSNSDKPSEPSSNECSSEGFYGNANDCKQFYRCVDNGKGGYTKYDFTCGDGTAWDADIQTCNHIDQVKTCHENSETHPVMHDDDNTQSTEASSTTKTTASSETSQGTTSENKNTCDNEGYFGDTQDCTKFYRCVDNGKGGYTKYDFTCGEGTIWDQDVTTCNHPQDVTNPSCKNKDESSTSTTASGSSISSSQHTTSSTESSQSSSNCSQEETSKKPDNQNVTCNKAGYYPNPNDCKKFYRCVDWDGDGKRFSVYHFECGEGTIWDPALDTCNHAESVYPPRDCSGSQSQSENQPPTNEGTQQETTTSQESTTTQKSTSQTSSEPITTQHSTTSEQTTTQLSTTPEQTTTQRSTTSKQTTTPQSTTSEKTTQKSTTAEQTTTQQTTQESTTSVQTTQQPTTSEQTMTQESTTSEQTTTQQTTTSESSTTQQSSTSEETTTQQSTTSEQTTTEQSTTSDQTTTQQSTTSEATTQQMATQQSSTSESDQTTTEQSTTSEQTTQESTTTEQLTTSEQITTQQSTTSESTTKESSTTESSTTESSTTEQSSTQASTTQQSEQSTTTDLTSSEGTTTEESNTEQSTTQQTNENSTTESGTDENSPENKCPETEEDQNLFVCPTSFKRHPKYCNLFYQCDEDDDTHDVKIAVFTCPNNTIYDESQIRCVDESKADKKCDGKIAQKRRFKRLDKNYKEPIVVTKESFACPSTGYFSFEKNSECSPAFLKCKTDKTNKLRGLVYQCPTNYVYWSVSKRCEPINNVRDCKRSHNNWTGRWEIPIERRNVAP